MKFTLNDEYNKILTGIINQGYVTLNDWYKLEKIANKSINFIEAINQFEKNTGSTFNKVIRERTIKFQEMSNKITSYFSSDELNSPDPISIFTKERINQLSSDSGYGLNDLTNFFLPALKKKIEFLVKRYL